MTFNFLREMQKHMHELMVKSPRMPKWIPLTREEIATVVRETPAIQYPAISDLMGNMPSLMGLNVFESSFAKEMRVKQMEVPLMQVCSEGGITLINARIQSRMDQVTYELRLRLEAYVTTDTTELLYTFDCDGFKGIKNFLRRFLWFIPPTKTKTIRIKGQVLYPYLNISLPHHQHHIKFYIQS